MTQAKVEYPKEWGPEQIAEFEKQLERVMAGGPNVLQPPATVPQLEPDAQDVVEVFSRAKNIVMAPNQLKYTPHGRLAFQLAVDVLSMVGRHRAAVELLDQAMPALIAARDVDERPDSENLGRLKKALNG